MKSELIAFSLLLLISSCGTDQITKKEYKLNHPADEVIIWELANFSSLNPITSVMAESGYAILTMFYPPAQFDFKTLEFAPILVKGLPEISENEKGELMHTYELRPEARWDNGDPITAKDIELTFKTFKNPKVDCAHKRKIYEFIHDVILYNDNPLKYTIVHSKKYMNALEASYDFPVIPKYLFDPKGLMDEFTIKQLTYQADELSNNSKIIEFADMINSEAFKRDKNILKGSGPYEIEEWTTGEKVVLKRKEKWWGDAFQGQNCYFEAYPSRIIHQVITDQTAAVTAMKGQNIDVMRAMKPKEFLELKENKNFLENFNFHTPMMLAWAYLGLNMKNPIFFDKKTRQALAHLVDAQKMKKIAAYDLVEVAVGPLRPDQTKIFNAEIKPYEFNLDIARNLLAEAGWKDSNGDGTIDKVISGKHTEFTINYDYVSGNDIRKNVGLLFQEEARKAGIKVEVRGIDATVLRENNKKHDFDMIYASWIGGVKQPDLKQIFHTDMANGGLNYESFGNAETDALLDSISVEIDEDKAAPMYKRLQQILHDEAVHIFLFIPKERLSIHKRFTNAYSSIQKPGYWAPGFKLEPTE
jgi:peptide/nickel transport system substrate-binding protein